MSEIIETPVRLAVSTAVYGAAGICCEDVEAAPTLRVELSIKPAQAADSVFDAIHSGTKITLGSSADRIDVGQRGWAYGAKSGSEAAARATEGVPC